MNFTDDEAWGLKQRHIDWIEQFRAKNNRPPRVLGIGNIANNNYKNAVVLRKIGIECDSLCYNYFHIMGCPEWEEAEFDNSGLDDFKPVWSRVDLHGYQRPRWFAQGMHGTAIDYLIAYREGLPEGEMLWKKLAAERDNPFQDSGTNIFFPEQTELETATYIVNFLELISNVNLESERIINNKELTRSHLFLFAKTNCLRRLFSHYDLIIGYATDGIFSLAMGKDPYIAYEHGTVRSIPFENDTQGKLCFLTYKQANHVLITNCDNNSAVERIGVSSFSFVPHALLENFTENGFVGQNSIEELKKKYSSDFVVFHPSRHQWSDDRDPATEKGNDLLVRGFAEILSVRQVRYSF